MSEPRVLKHYFAGESVAGEGALSSVEPAQPKNVMAVAPLADKSVVDRCVDAARNASTGWRAQTGPARAGALKKWGQAIAANSADIAHDLAREIGKPIGEAQGEVGRCVAILDYYAGECVREVGQVIPALQPGALQYTLHEPLGVCALICPWNFPLAIPLWKAAPALAMGNAVVLKPAEQSPLAADWLARTANEAGLEGAFSILYGAGETGASLVGHDGVDAVSFTGSVEVGGKIAEECAKANRKFQGEMGGKNVGIVLADADLPKAAGLVAAGAMRFAGQKCTATSRVVVERSVADAFMAELSAAIDSLPVGAPTDTGTAVGPVIEESAQERIDRIISSATYTKAYSGSSSEPGFYVPPTVFAGVEADSELAQEEIFGPVLAVIEADDFEQAIEFANNTRFGLSASLYTLQIAKALDYIDRIEVGLVRVNGDTTGVDPHAPFGGMKASSSHSREQGPVAKEFYTETKTVQINR